LLDGSVQKIIEAVGRVGRVRVVFGGQCNTRCSPA
jgi:hypothetical protein